MWRYLQNLYIIIRWKYTLIIGFLACTKVVRVMGPDSLYCGKWRKISVMPWPWPLSDSAHYFHYFHFQFHVPRLISFLVAKRHKNTTIIKIGTQVVIARYPILLHKLIMKLYKELAWTVGFIPLPGLFYHNILIQHLDLWEKPFSFN